MDVVLGEMKVPTSFLKCRVRGVWEDGQLLPKEATGVGIRSGMQAEVKPEPGKARERGTEFKGQKEL